MDKDEWNTCIKFCQIGTHLVSHSAGTMNRSTIKWLTNSVNKMATHALTYPFSGLT